MSRIEIFPKHLLHGRKVEEVITFIKGLHCRDIDHKEFLCDWCAFTGYPLTAELVRRVYPAG